MGGYLLNFIVYTTAMIGVIFVAFFVYKKTTVNSSSTSKSKFLGIEDTISLAPRKQVFVIRAGKEKFLVASDAERTTFLTKLEDNKSVQVEQQSEVSQIPESNSYFDRYKNSDAAIRKFARKFDL